MSRSACVGKGGGISNCGRGWLEHPRQWRSAQGPNPSLRVLSRREARPEEAAQLPRSGTVRCPGSRLATA
eukprot:scaffold93021_cov54-Phaeocystis_antarctica.AAC.6